jgi:O-antigen/teichoic acid export membrane protein
MSFCFAMLALALSLYRHELLALLAPASYQVAAPAVPLLVGALVFAALGTIMGHTFVALGDSRTPLRINVWTSLLSFALNVFCIARWGFMGAAWANFLFNVLGYALTDVVLSRRMRPATRGYLGVVAYLAALTLVGLEAPPVLRAPLVLAGAAGSLLVSPALRRDVVRVWNLRTGAR